MHPKNSPTRALGLPSSPSAPQEPLSPVPTSRDAQGCTGGDKGRVIPLSWGSQHLEPAWRGEHRLAEGHSCFPKICWCWQGGHVPGVPASHPSAQETGWHRWGTPGLSQAAPSSRGSPSQEGTDQGTQGVSNPPLPSSKGGKQLPWETTQCPSPAETPNSWHQWWRGPHHGTGSGPRSQTRAGAGRERGRIQALGGCSQRLFLCRKRQNSLGSGPGPSAGNRGAGRGLGDMGTCPRAQCLIAFQHHPGRG